MVGKDVRAGSIKKNAVWGKKRSRGPDWGTGGGFREGGSCGGWEEGGVATSKQRGEGRYQIYDESDVGKRGGKGGGGQGERSIVKMFDGAS